MDLKFINKNSILGLIFGLVIAAFIVVIKFGFDLDKSDFIALISILVNIILVSLIAAVFQKRFTDSRQAKNHIVKEIEEVHRDYKLFTNRLIRDELEHKYILRWFKLMGFRIKHIDYNLKTHFGVEYESISKLHKDYRILLTNSQSFNDTFSQNKLKIDIGLQNTILEDSKNFSHAFLDLIFKVHYC